MRALSIGILNLNQSGLTLDLLKTLATIPSDEWTLQIILVDNGSETTHIEALQTWVDSHRPHFDSLSFLTPPENRGVAGGRNLILENAHHDRVLFLDNDLSLPSSFTWLDTLWQHLDSDPQVAIAGPVLVFSELPHIVQAAGLGFTPQARVGYLERGTPLKDLPQTTTEVIASPAACWLLRKEAATAVNNFSEDYFPFQYEDIDFCVQLHQQGWKTLCDRSIAIKHIENVTTRSLESNPFARVTVRHAMIFKKKFSPLLPQIATLTDQDIDWGDIPHERTSAHS